MPLFNPSSSGGAALRFRSESSLVVSASAQNASVDLTAVNANRTKACFFNAADKAAFFKCGVGASLTSWTVKIDPGGYYETPVDYTGALSVMWDVGVNLSGKGMYTEFIDAIE